MARYNLEPVALRDDETHRPPAEGGETNKMELVGIHAVSTPVHRTVLSVQNLLDGLFAPDLRPWQLPIELVREIDPFAPNVTKTEHGGVEVDAKCTIDSMKDAAFADPKVLATEQQYKEFRRDITLKLFRAGLLPSVDNAPDPLGWPWLCEICICLREYDLLPASITFTDVEEIEAHLARRWRQLFLNEAYYQLAVEPILAGITRRAHDCLSACSTDGDKPPHSIQRQVQVYSAHDSTLFALLGAISLHQQQVGNDAQFQAAKYLATIPQYASTLSFILWDHDDGVWVQKSHAYFSRSLQVVYNGEHICWIGI